MSNASPSEPEQSEPKSNAMAGAWDLHLASELATRSTEEARRSTHRPCVQIHVAGVSCFGSGNVGRQRSRSTSLDGAGVVGDVR